MKLITLALVAFLLVGFASAEDFIKGEAKGPDAPGALMIGAGNLAVELLNVSGGSIDAVNQAFYGDAVMALSGLDPAIFDQPFFAKDGWVTDGGSYGRTPSQTAFLQDKTGENLRWSPKQGDW